MRSIIRSVCLALGIAMLAATPALAGSEFRITDADGIEWQSGPGSLPEGAQMKVLAGDPGAEGPFVVRFRFPADFKVAWHTHPMTENLTLISGAAKHETKMDEAPTDLAPGDFIHLPKNTAHKVWTLDEPAVLQLTAVGPFEIEYLDPADDPRNDD